MAAGMREFRYAVIHLVARGQEEERVVAAADHDRAWLAGPKIFLADLPAVLARRHPQPHGIAVVDHDAIGADIDPFGVGVAHDDEIARADVAAAVELVQKRHRKF